MLFASVLSSASLSPNSRLHIEEFQPPLHPDVNLILRVIHEIVNSAASSVQPSGDEVKFAWIDSLSEIWE